MLRQDLGLCWFAVSSLWGREDSNLRFHESVEPCGLRITDSCNSRIGRSLVTAGAFV